MSVKYTVVTYELRGASWVPVVSHTFYGDTGPEVLSLVEAHKRSDAFFRGSFAGSYNGIALRNDKGRWQS